MSRRDESRRPPLRERASAPPAEDPPRDTSQSDKSGHIAPGSRFGRYDIVSRIATGGMAEVWLAHASSVGGFQKRVVLKTMLPHLAEQPHFKQMFIREASLAAQLSHPNIVHIFDLGENDGRYFIAMEYVAGRTLRQIRKRAEQQKSGVPHWFLLRTLIGACEGLQFAHDFQLPDGRASNLVHRDVSPENIMVSFSGVVKVLDFGVARGVAMDSSTSTGVLVGKLLYTAPERVHGVPADRRSDIYALGVILYEYLTGRRPFAGDDEVALLAKVAHETPKDPRELASVPDELARITMKAMARDPTKRYQEASQLARDLRDYLRKAGGLDDENPAAYLAGLFPDSPEVPASHRKLSVKSADKTEQIEGLPTDADVVARSTAENIEEAARGFESERTAQEVLRIETADEVFDVAMDSASGEGVAADDPTRPARIENKAIPADVRDLIGAAAPTAPTAQPLAPAAALADTAPPNPAPTVAAPDVIPPEVREHPTEQTPSHPSTVFQVSSSRSTPPRATDVFNVVRSKETVHSDVFTAYSTRRTPLPPAPDFMSKGGSLPPQPAPPWGGPSSSTRSRESLPPKERPKPDESAKPKEPWSGTGRKNQKKQNPAAAHVERGFEHMRNGRFLQALSEWETALELDPDNGAVRANLARLRRQLEEE